MDAALKERYLAKVKPTADALEAAAKANMDASSTKLFSEAGPLHNGKPLMAIKDIEHRVRVTIQHEDATKKKEKKVLGISWARGPVTRPRARCRCRATSRSPGMASSSVHSIISALTT